MSSKRSFGVHLRLQNSYAALAEQALNLGLTSFQLFFMPQNKKNYVHLTKQDTQAFATLRHHFSSIYVHSSYWINLATGKKESAIIAEQLLKKELYIAERLQISHLVLHPGSANGHPKTTQDPYGKKAGIASLAAILNNITKENIKLKILLENTAHDGSSIGSDLQDFVELRALLTHQEKIGFCLDFAHAYAYGYDVTQTASFIETIEKTIGCTSVDLIHLNDSLETLGSHKDHHEVPGKGLIGKDALKALILHKKFANTPFICELPLLEEEELKTIICNINGWLAL